MSQLNPNAAEFVPVSPTRSIPSPACRMLMNDEVISQSPKRPVNVDINVPNISDFETEIKSRPSEVDTYSNGHSSDNDHSISTPEKMENILNGKNIDEIVEFQPGSTPQKAKPSEEFHFGPNAAPFTPVRQLDQSEAALSTRAIYGDESAATLGTSFNESILHDATVDLMSKESDPMSMSFYADKGDANPFDLNEVQILPDESNESLLDAPEQNPSPENITLNNDDAIQTTDLDKQAYDDEKELASPLEPDVELLETDKPDEGKEECDNVEIEPNNETMLISDFCQLTVKSPIVPLPQDVELISPEPRPESSKLESFERLTDANLPEPVVAKDHLEMVETETPFEKAQHDFDTFQAEQHVEIISETKEEMDPFQPEITPPKDEVNLLLDSSPVEEEKSNDLIESIETAGRNEVQSPVSFPDCDSERCDLLMSKSPICDLPEAKSPVCDISEKSSVCDIVESKSPIPDQVVESQEDLVEPIQESCDYTKPALIEEANAHFEELCQPLEADVIPESHQTALTSSVKDDVTSRVVCPDMVEDSFVEQHFEKEESCPIEKNQESCAFEKSEESCQIEKKEESCLIEKNEPAAPQPVEKIDDVLMDVTNHIANISIDPLPLKTQQIDVKTENISPEYPEQATVTPSEESKQDDVPTAPLIEEPVQEPSAQIQDEIPVAALATVAAVGVAAAAVAVAADDTPKITIEVTPAVTEPVTPPVKPEEKKKAASVKKTPATKTPTAAPKTTPRTTLAAKTPTTKPSPSPKTAAPKSGTKPALSSTSPKPALSSASHKPAAPANRLSMAPKPKTAAAPPKSSDKKPLTNGDVKAPVKSTLLAKKTVSETATAKPYRPLSAAASKSTTTAAKPANPRPATAPKAAAPRTTTTGLAAKPRPATLSSRPTPKPASTTSAASKTSPKAPTTTTATGAPKPRVPPITAAAKPRVPLSKPMGKAPDTEKQNKESANKITASKTSTAKTTAATTVRRVESKTAAARTTVSKTTTTTMKSTTAKKPAEIIRNPNKTKTTKIEKPKENGISTVVTEEITVVNTTNSVINNEPDLVKDNSPVDNKLLIGENTLIEANAAD